MQKTDQENFSKISKKIVCILCGLVIIMLSFSKIYFADEQFSWMAFQERDLSSAAEFLNSGSLTHLGPEISGGGRLPGPFLTIVFSLFLWVFSSIKGVFYLLHIANLLMLLLAFDLVRQKLNTTTALVYVGVLAVASHAFLYPLGGWHTALAPFFATLVIWLGNRAWCSQNKLAWLIAGFVAGLSFQIHASVVVPPILALLLAFASNPKRSFQTVHWILIGIFLSNSYYFYFDWKSDFENTNILFNENINEFYFNNNYFNYIKDRYLSYTALNIFPADSLLSHFFKMNEHYRDVFYLLQFPFLILGLGSMLTRRKNALMALFLVAAMCVPLIIQRPEARYHIFSGLCWALFFSVGLVWLVVDSPFSSTIRKVMGVSIFLVLAFSAILKPTADGSKLYAIYHKAALHNLAVTEALIHDLKLKPKDYENSFYFYRGEKIWPFWTSVPLPSKHTYSYLFNQRKPSKTIDLGDNGLILLEARHRDAINLTHVKIINEIQVGEFIAVIYYSPYKYRMVPQYSDIEETEPNALLSADNQNVANTWAASQKIEIDTKEPKKLELNVNLRMNNTSGGLTGFAEIQSEYLRQSQFAEQAPYFIANPTIVVYMKDKTKFKFPLMEQHLYARQPVTPWGDVYAHFGEVLSSLNLGSLYVEAPYGRPIEIKNKRTDDISHVEFMINDYGNLTEQKFRSLNKVWLVHAKN